MNKLLLLVNALIALVALNACATQREYQSDGPSPVVPQRVAQTMTLPGQAQQDILLAVIDASATGVVVTMYRARGVATSTIVQDRDVVVRALDVQGKVIATTSIENPRDIHTVGSRNPAAAVQPTARSFVRFAWSDKIAVVQVEVLHGANEGTKTQVNVDTKALRNYDPPSETQVR